MPVRNCPARAQYSSGHDSSCAAGASPDPIEVSTTLLILGKRTIKGWSAGLPTDSEDTLRFAEAAGIRPIIEKYPLEQAAEGYARMMGGGAQYRVVLTMG